MKRSDGHLRVIITIDGPAGAGKSSTARRLAQKLGLHFLDTGAMYRGITAAALRQGLDTADNNAVAELAEQLHIRFDFSTDPPRLLVDNVDMSQRIRDPDVTVATSDIAANPNVRHLMVRAQRWIGKQNQHLVTEGRDQGSIVFPDATIKFYLDASPEIRCARRADELIAAGKKVDRDELLKQIINRDHRDMTRPDGPLVCPKDAIKIDSSDMNFDQVINTLIDHVRLQNPKLVDGSAT